MSEVSQTPTWDKLKGMQMDPCVDESVWEILDKLLERRD